MTTIEARLTELEQRVRALEGAEGVRRTLSLYARYLDENRPELLEAVFTADAHLRTIPWGADVQGRERVGRAFTRYVGRFQNPRRYCANESITVDGETAKAFSYWLVTQEDQGRSVIGWGTYDWAFRLEGGTWKAIDLVITILAMTSLDRGWAVPDKIMMPFERQ
jgi:SnoaL-like protein